MFIFFLFISAEYLSIPKGNKGRALCVCFGQNFKGKLALEASTVVKAFRMLVREPQGRGHVFKVMLGLVDLSRNSGEN